MKPALTLRLAACVAVALGALWLSPRSARAETVLRLASPAPTGSIWGQWAQDTADEIERASDGALRIELLLDSSAGNEPTILRQTARGRLDIAFVSNVPLTVLARELALPSTAYLFDSPQQGTCVTYRHLSQIMDDLMQDAGVMPLTWMEVGHYVLFSRTPLSGPRDLAGQKVRIPTSVTDAELARALGVSGVPAEPVDALPLLQSGGVDAAWFPALYGIAVGAHRVAPHITVTNHGRLIGTVAVSARVWARLTEQERDWLRLFTQNGPDLTQAVLSAETIALTQLAEAGIAVHYPDAAQLTEWKAATAGVLEAVIARAGDQAQSVADQIAIAKADCGP